MSKNEQTITQMPGGIRIVKKEERKIIVDTTKSWEETVQQHAKEQTAQAKLVAKAETFADLVELNEIANRNLKDALASRDIEGMPLEALDKEIKTIRASISEYNRLMEEAKTSEGPGIALEGLRVLARRKLVKQRAREITLQKVEKPADAWAWLATFAENATLAGLLKKSSQQPAITVANVGYAPAFEQAEELITAIAEFEKRVKEVGKNRRLAYEGEVSDFLMSLDDVKTARSESVWSLRDFLANAKAGSSYVLRVFYEDRKSESKKKKYGDVLLRWETPKKLAAQKASQADLAHILFSRRRGGERTFQRPYLNVRGTDISDVYPLMRDAMERAFRREDEIANDKSETERLKDISLIPDLITERELVAGTVGTVPYHIRHWLINRGKNDEREVPLTFHVKAFKKDGEIMVRVLEATSKTMDYAKFLEGYANHDVPLKNFLNDPRMKVIRAQNQFWEVRWVTEKNCREAGIEMDAASLMELLIPREEADGMAAGFALIWHQKTRGEYRPFQTGIVAERTGRGESATITIRWAAPGYTAGLMKGMVGKTYPLYDIPNKLRSYFRLALEKIAGFSHKEIPIYLQPIQVSDEKEEMPEEPGAGEPAPDLDQSAAGQTQEV